MTGAALTVIDNPSRDDVQFLGDRLYEFNVKATGIADGREMAVLLRDADRRIIAGLYGWTWGGCAFVDRLWIDEGRRRRGLGTRLMHAAESEARKRGAFQMLLHTHSFQAPAFYERLGFERVAALDEYPRGHQDVFMRKSLAS
jgi:GNAT superfamily N-acetyltransferase